jgi:SAM-dependent MidA family methyltransferase
VNLLRQKIEQEIRERGPIPFSRYMELCLYDPELGYYSRNAEQFGKAGDFYTSSDVHAVFGRLLARQFDEMWRILGRPERITLMELGPGRGLFAQDVLDWSEKKFPDFFCAVQYVLVESSPALRERIEATLREHLESGRATLMPDSSRAEEATPSGAKTQTQGEAQTAALKRCATEDRIAFAAPAPPFPTILFANEFFDALPLEIGSSQGSLRVDSQNGRFVETWAPASAEELEFLDRYSTHPEPGERVEVPLQSQLHMRTAATLDCGFIVVIDYGYTRAEQLAGRHRGTLKAIRQHSLSANPYEAPGEQDITADVNFTALAAVAEEQGMQVQKLVTQSQFLMGIGEANQFADAFEDCRLPQIPLLAQRTREKWGTRETKVALQLKHLVTPAGTGESFHVLVASKGAEAERVAALSGLNFGHWT